MPTESIALSADSDRSALGRLRSPEGSPEGGLAALRALDFEARVSSRELARNSAVAESYLRECRDGDCNRVEGIVEVILPIFSDL